MSCKTVEERFWSKVDKSAGPDECWPWKAGTIKGYGVFWIGGKTVRAHRFAYEFTKGLVPAGMEVLHDCDNPPCCNPKHLFAGTHTVNMQDCVAKGRIARGERQGTYTHPETRPRGERNGQAKLTEDKVREIRRLRSERKTQEAIGWIVGAGRATIGAVIRGESWKHVP